MKWEDGLVSGAPPSHRRVLDALKVPGTSSDICKRLGVRTFADRAQLRLLLKRMEKLGLVRCFAKIVWSRCSNDGEVVL